MKKWSKLHLLSTFIFVFSCTPEEDVTYTSISGLWKCEELNEAAAVKIFNVDIDNVINYEDTYIISNFHNTSEEYFIRATVTESRLIIPNQSVLNLIVSGEGSISPDFKQITASYTVDDGGRTANFTATFFR